MLAIAGPAFPAAASRGSVAVVDDDVRFARHLETLLAMHGYDARSYAGGGEILAALRRGDCPDMVLLDVAMPGLDGLQTLKALKMARPDLPVIMLSERQQAHTIVEAVHLGAADYIVTPHDRERLDDVAANSALTQAIARHLVPGAFHGPPSPAAAAASGAVHGWDQSPAMRPVAQVIEQVCDSDVTVLIRGESGVGKELVARSIHDRSPRRRMPFVKVNCAALPAELIESELFGHERGAFTGAAATRIGKFEQAHLGTILLDEIGELRPALQAKLLQVLQDGEYTRLGSNKTVTTGARVLAATNRPLEQLIARGEFREDLYYRLRVIETVVPPLRERRDEILPLADFFVAKYAARYRRPARMLPPELWRLFLEYEWPGNVRELENTITRFVLLQDARLLARELSSSRRRQEPIPAPAAPPPACPAEWEEGRRLVDVARDAAVAAERVAILDTLRQVDWNRKSAAEMLGVSYKTLLRKIKESGIQGIP